MSLNSALFLGRSENISSTSVKVFNIYASIGKDIYASIGKDCYGADDFVPIIRLDMWYLKSLLRLTDVLTLFTLNSEATFLTRFFQSTEHEPFISFAQNLQQSDMYPTLF